MEQILTADEMRALAEQNTARQETLRADVLRCVECMKNRLKENRDISEVPVQCSFKNGITDRDVLDKLIELGYKRVGHPVVIGGVVQTSLFFTI